MAVVATDKKTPTSILDSQGSDKVDGLAKSMLNLDTRWISKIYTN